MAALTASVTVPLVTGFVRFVGLFNAAVWLGASFFFTFGAAPAVFSTEMKSLLDEKNFPYFSGAIAQILIGRYFHWQLACATVALLHLLVQWLYLGKSPQKLWLGLLIAIITLSLIGGSWLQPKLKTLHTIAYTDPKPDRRTAARASFRAWHGVAQAINLLMLSGLVLYLWRVANPPDPTRFVSTAKFRG